MSLLSNLAVDVFDKVTPRAISRPIYTYIVKTYLKKKIEKGEIMTDFGLLGDLAPENQDRLREQLYQQLERDFEYYAQLNRRRIVKWNVK